MFDNDVLLLVAYYSNMVVQRCLNHRRDLSNSSPSSLYSLVCDVPCIAPLIASVALYRTFSILLQNESLFAWS